MSERWKAKTSEELQQAASGGSAAAFYELLLRLMPKISRKASSYRLPGLDRDDLVQEGTLGVLGAVRNYRPERGPFERYALSCARHAIDSAVRRALSQKEKAYAGHEPIETSETLPANPAHEPERLLDARAAADELRRWYAEELSPFERQVLTHYLAGRSYGEISSLLSSHSKAVDNALQRVRRKLRRFYSTHLV